MFKGIPISEYRLLAHSVIFTILFQPSNEGNGMNALSSESTSETFYAKNKSQTMESALKRLTVIFSVVIAVLTIAFFITVAIYRGV